MSWFIRPLIIAVSLGILTPSAVLEAAGEPPLHLQIPLASEARVYLRAIILQNPAGALDAGDTLVREGTENPVVIALGLGDLPGKTVRIEPHSPGQTFRVVQQFETSMTLMDEGPHMDLLDWRHHVSPWQVLPSIDGLTFQAMEISTAPFPEATRDEIVAAVDEALRRWIVDGFDPDTRWITLATQCTNPLTYPCGVGVSKVRLRVQIAASDAWQTLQSIEIIVPLGC